MATAAGYGAPFGLLPIGWIVLNAVFLYNLTVETGTFETVKRSVVALSDDRRMQALLIAFCFGAFLEGAAGFGTPVAVSAALLVGAGFRPLHAAGLALLANTAPVAFGALGTPITTLARVTGLDELKLSAMAGRQLPFFSLLVPAWLVWAMAGWRGVLGVWPAVLVCGGSFAVVQFLVSNYHGPWLVDVVAGWSRWSACAVLLRFWRPSETWRFPDERETQRADAARTPARRDSGSRRVGLGAVGAADAVRVRLGAAAGQGGAEPGDAAMGGAGAAPRDRPHRARWSRRRSRRRPGSTSSGCRRPGTGIFLAAVASAVWLRVAPRRFVRHLAANGLPDALAAGDDRGHAGDRVHDALQRHGRDAGPGDDPDRGGLPAVRGAAGLAGRGPDRVGHLVERHVRRLQVVTATRLAESGVLPLDPDRAAILLAAANSTGGVMGKMIDAQSIVVAGAATGQPGQEGAVLRYVFWHSIALAVLVGLLVLFQAYVWTGAIP